jgi:type IV pilus assembly protein PilW
MNHPRCSAASRHIQGFSLIELMVSLTIGLIIMIAAVSAYIGAAGAGKMGDAQGRMNEDAQAALNILTQQIRMAGTNLVQSNRDNAFRHNPVYSATYIGGTSTAYGTTSFTTSLAALSTFAIRGCDGKFSNLATANVTLDTLTCAGSSTLPDSIAVNYEADRYNTVPTTTGGTPTDCLGNSVPIVTATFAAGTDTTATYTVADNRFYIGTSTYITSPSLYCKGNGNANAQPLVENVEDMQFKYGTISATDNSTTATVAGYLDAFEVNTDANLTALPSFADQWGKVLAVRICVLVRSENPVAPDAASARYVPCFASAAVSAPDLRLRRAYTTTVVLRNRRY